MGSDKLHVLRVERMQNAAHDVLYQRVKIRHASLNGAKFSPIRCKSFFPYDEVLW